MDTSEPPLIELREAHAYQPQQQALEAALKSLGITCLMRDPLSATLRLQSLLKHLPSGSNIEVLLQQEIDFYLSSTVQFIDSSSESLENGPASRQSSDSSVPKGVTGGSVQLRRSSSSSPLVGSRGRATAMAAMEPYMVLRNDTVRAEWRSVFGSRERIPWKDFWHKLVQPQVRGLSGRNAQWSPHADRSAPPHWIWIQSEQPPWLFEQCTTTSLLGCIHLPRHTVPHNLAPCPAGSACCCCSHTSGALTGSWTSSPQTTCSSTCSAAAAACSPCPRWTLLSRLTSAQP